MRCAGAGSFQGKSLHFNGGDGSFEADPGVLMGKGSASGKSFTCWGEGTYQVGTLHMPAPFRALPAATASHVWAWGPTRRAVCTCQHHVGLRQRQELPMLGCGDLPGGLSAHASTIQAARQPGGYN